MPDLDALRIIIIAIKTISTAPPTAIPIKWGKGEGLEWREPGRDGEGEGLVVVQLF